MFQPGDRNAPSLEGCPFKTQTRFQDRAIWDGFRSCVGKRRPRQFSHFGSGIGSCNGCPRAKDAKAVRTLRMFGKGAPCWAPCLGCSFVSLTVIFGGNVCFRAKQTKSYKVCSGASHQEFKALMGQFWNLSKRFWLPLWKDAQSCLRKGGKRTSLAKVRACNQRT